MSPEMLNNQEYTFNSDVWSFCMVFYEIIHGYCAWNAENPQDLLTNIQKQPLTFLEAISPEIQAFLKQGLKYEKAERLRWEDMHATDLFKLVQEQKSKQELPELTTVRLLI